MNMSTSMTMAMSATNTAGAAAATSSMAMSMGMDMGGGGGGAACKISMLWNWYTVDSCFISSSWHVTSSGMFAGSCIGVIFLVMALEFLRRASREYDRYILQAARQKHQQNNQSASLPPQSNASSINKSGEAQVMTLAAAACTNTLRFRPNVLQQVIRAALHMLQFAVAYFIMLLAMYYNGYIIICIILGAFLGAFVFSWEDMALQSDDKKEATFCCG